MRFPDEEVQAMKARLADRKEQRLLDRDICQVICLVKHIPFQQPRAEVAQAPGAGERLEMGPHFSFEALKRMAAGSWLVGMVLAVVAFLCYGLRMV